MSRSSRITLLTIAILIASVMPARAQDGANSVSFGGVGFVVDGRLGASVNATSVPEAIPVGDGGSLGAQPPHVTFTLYGERPDGARPR